MKDTQRKRPLGRQWAAPDWGEVGRNTLLLFVLAVMLWLAFNVRLPSAEQLREWIEGLGWAGWLGFIALYAVVAVTPIPVTIMAVAGGMLYGVTLGSAFSVVGALLGSWAAYWLARVLGKETVLKMLGKHAAKMEGHLEGAGFQAVTTLRVMPGLPYWPVNYGSGIFGVTQRDYLAASAVAMVPGQISLVAVGSLIANPTAWNLTVLITAWVVVITMTIWAYRQWRQASQGDEDDASDGDVVDEGVAGKSG